MSRNVTVNISVNPLRPHFFNLKLTQLLSLISQQPPQSLRINRYICDRYTLEEPVTVNRCYLFTPEVEICTSKVRHFFKFQTLLSQQPQETRQHLAYPQLLYA
jgi:hypothetical protein